MYVATAFHHPRHTTSLWTCGIATLALMLALMTLDQLEEFYSLHDHSEHVYVVADVNIYWRYHRVRTKSSLADCIILNKTLGRELFCNKATQKS
jgi:hypothetical protein